jgi:hypothetical protein
LSTASPHPSTPAPNLSPTSSTGQLQFPLTPPNPRAIVLPDTRPPETQRLSLCKGKAEREPAVPGGLVNHDQAKRSRAAPLGTRYAPTGSKRAAIRVAWSACRDLPALGLVQVHSATLPLDYPASRPRDPMFAVPSQPDSIVSCSASQPPARRQSLRDSGGTRRQIPSLVLCVDLVGSNRIWPAHVGRLVGPDGSRTVPSDRLDDQTDDQASQAAPRAESLARPRAEWHRPRERDFATDAEAATVNGIHPAGRHTSVT